MSKLTRWSALTLLLAAIVFCYAVGVFKGVVLLVIIGVLLECYFWVKALRPNKKSDAG